ncbi:MAG TPA: DUF1254 domain-containing protein [Solirubrobacteraceae bacterium]|nr:DUF1254 domain-containing protein [Solirubrobacteraceae bacterium]
MNVATHTERGRVSAEEAQEIAVEAYVYLYPLVTMEVTRRQMTNLPAGEKPGFGPMDTFSHIREFPSAEFKAVVRPNFDTLYSSAWLDLTEEPRVVSVPDTDGRYYLLPLYDMWTDAFAVPGKRTSGTGPGDYAIVGPGWRGNIPDGVERIQAPTSYVWIIGRTQTNGPRDYDAVNVVQDGFAIAPLSRWPDGAGATEARIDPSVDMQTPPLQQVNGMTGADYFARAAALMQLHRPHATDWSTVARMRRIGIIPGEDLRVGEVDLSVQDALKSAPGIALKLMAAKMPTLAQVTNGWQMLTDTMGVYGNYYLKRAIISMAGLGANQPEDAIYPLSVSDADGEPLDGDNDYVMHFAKPELPPVAAFWSVTMYDVDGFQAANPINRFAIGDRDELHYNADGSLDLYIQYEHPGADKESNWLPAPRGPLGVTMRLYAPKPEALDGRWVPPPIKRTSRSPNQGEH